MRDHRERDIREAERGLSLIEVLLSAVLLIVASGAMVAGQVLAGAVDRDGNYRHAAIEAVLSTADEIRATPIDSVNALFGPESDDEGMFSIPALENDGSGDIAGRVIVVTDERTTDAEIGMALGMPRDLDGDGDAKNTDVSLTALVLPVIVEARWGPPGKRESFRVPVILIR